MNRLWLPRGHHWDLHIVHVPAENAGPFTGGGKKLLLHTTEAPWDSVDRMDDVLIGKRAAPHVLIGGRPGTQHPVVMQFVPFNRAGRALANDPYDGYQTNRANVIQIEINGYAGQSQDWDMWTYKALANLVELIHHRYKFPLEAPQDFSHPRRMSDSEFVKASGIVGHSMAPDNDHWDPGRFREGRLLNLINNMPSGGYDL